MRQALAFALGLLAGGAITAAIFVWGWKPTVTCATRGGDTYHEGDIRTASTGKRYVCVAVGPAWQEVKP